MTDTDTARTRARIVADVRADLFDGDQQASEEFERAVNDALALLDQTRTPRSGSQEQ